MGETWCYPALILRPDPWSRLPHPAMRWSSQVVLRLKAARRRLTPRHARLPLLPKLLLLALRQLLLALRRLLLAPLRQAQRPEQQLLQDRPTSPSRRPA